MEKVYAKMGNREYTKSQGNYNEDNGCVGKCGYGNGETDEVPEQLFVCVCACVCVRARAFVCVTL